MAAKALTSKSLKNKVNNMFLEFLLSPLTNKDSFVGGVADNYCKIKESRRDRENSLREREVKALEELAEIRRLRRLNPK